MDKEFEKLAKLARDQGWQVTEAKQKVEWRPNNGYPVLITSNHYHSVRTLANTKAELHKRGLMEEDELRRHRRQQAKIQKLMGAELSADNLKKMVHSRADLMNDPDWNWGMFSDKDWIDFSRLLATKIVLYNGGRHEIGVGMKVFRDLEPVCTRCGKRFQHLFGWFKHEQTCEKTRGEDMITEIVEDPPDSSEMLQCPDAKCSEVFYKSQTYERAEHMRIVHDTVECPSCLRVMRVNSLDRHLEEFCPVNNRGKIPPIQRGRRREEPTVAAQLTPGQAPPAPTVAPTTPKLAPTTPPVAAVLPTDDDTLWSLLEMVLDGPVTLNRHTLTLVNQWMDSTKALRQLVMEQRK